MVPLLANACSTWGADGGEGDGEVAKGRCERNACVSDREGDELHPSSKFFEGRN